MSGNQWGPPPPGQQFPPPPPPPPWQQGPGYGGPPPPPPYGQQQFGWGAPPGGPRPPKKKRGGLIVLFVGLGVLVVGLVGLKVVSSVLKHHGDSDYSEPAPIAATTRPTYEPSVSPSLPSTTRTMPPSTPAYPVTTTTRPTAPRTTKTTPPPKPGPSDLDLVARNKLYAAGTMKSVGCHESSSRPATAAGARANYSNLVKCLNKAWPALVAKAGGKFRPPKVQTFSGSISTPCGTWYASGPPFYCGSNYTIYMNLTEDTGNYNRWPQSYNKVWARMWMLHQFAHEYGHHVQNLTGIFAAAHQLEYDAGDQATQLQLSRRIELQASCFSDIFIGSNRSSYPVTGQSLTQWQWLIWHVTDDANDHGDPNNHKYWATRGFNSRTPKVCNTFTASAARVQ